MFSTSAEERYSKILDALFDIKHEIQALRNDVARIDIAINHFCNSKQKYSRAKPTLGGGNESLKSECIYILEHDISWYTLANRLNNDFVSFGTLYGLLENKKQTLKDGLDFRVTDDIETMSIIVRLDKHKRELAYTDIVEIMVDNIFKFYKLSIYNSKFNTVKNDRYTYYQICFRDPAPLNQKELAVAYMLMKNNELDCIDNIFKVAAIRQIATRYLD